jgi:hypothetical protein
MLLFTMSDGSVHSGRERRYLEHVSRMRAWYAKEATMEIGALRRPNTPDTLDFDAKKYLENADSNDGRRTEAQLQNWFRTVTPADDLYEQLHSGLSLSWPAMGRLPARKRVSTS